MRELLSPGVGDGAALREPGLEPTLQVDRLAALGLQKLLRASVADLDEVKDVGETRARSVKEGLTRLAESSILDRYS